MLAREMRKVVVQLASGEIHVETACRIFTAQIAGVETLEQQHAELRHAARLTVLKAISLQPALQALGNAIPRETKAIDSLAP